MNRTENKNEAEAAAGDNIVAGNPLICRSRPPEFCSGYHLFKSSFCFVELLIG
ncbi:unnamed protein product [Brassica napus]|uniref:(rape) hypothetical protein n=1 Tax=Brassica napus TaxID=3708 RepID=A0A816RZ82_BRANA|nr:unnamed protein product [Brassica napus]